MIDLFKLRIDQGRQYIEDLALASPPPAFHGLPFLDGAKCTGCADCVSSCPTGAVTLDPLKIDLGACTFCAACARSCPEGAITFTSEHRLAATSRDALVVTEGMKPEEYVETAIRPRNDLKGLFGRSLKIRSVSAGGCNACELELAATTNVNFDVGRYGIEITASPRHADVIVVSGPVTERMALPLEKTILATPEPRLIVLFGACAVSGGVFSGSPALERGVLSRYRADLFVPGSPPHPLTMIDGLMRLLGRRGTGRAS
jgi:Ni,Fe-hydrogenase III small subunit/ferredoxin